MDEDEVDQALQDAIDSYCQSGWDKIDQAVQEAIDLFERFNLTVEETTQALQILTVSLGYVIDRTDAASQDGGPMQ